MNLRRGLYRSLARASAALTLVHPRLGLALAAQVGARSLRSGAAWRAPRPGELRALLPALAPADVRRIRRAISVQAFRNLALNQLIAWRGVAAVEPLLETVHAGPLLRLRQAGTPIVVVSWHHGPSWATSAALHRLGLPGLCPTTRTSLPPGDAAGPVRHWSIARDGSDAAFLKEALLELERGGIVAMNLDWHEERGIPVTFLGRRVFVAPGVAWLARHTGARLVPTTRRWIGTSARIEVAFHEALPEPALAREPARDFERALLETASAWFDAWLRANPGTLRLRRLRQLRKAPPASEAGAPQPPLHRMRSRPRQRGGWERRWTAPDYAPGWMGRDLGREIREAVETGWFTPGGRALDAGCGEGDVAAFLAEHGYHATGVDLAEGALVRARARHAERPGVLEFLQGDLCLPWPTHARFDAVVDRGCFLHFEVDERRAYVRRLAQACAADARVLVWIRAFRDGIPDGDPEEQRRRTAEIAELVGADFEIERVAPSPLDSEEGRDAAHKLPGLAFWLRRRAG